MTLSIQRVCGVPERWMLWICQRRYSRKTTAIATMKTTSRTSTAASGHRSLMGRFVSSRITRTGTTTRHRNPGGWAAASRAREVACR